MAPLSAEFKAAREKALKADAHGWQKDWQMSDNEADRFEYRAYKMYSLHLSSLKKKGKLARDEAAFGSPWPPFGPQHMETSLGQKTLTQVAELNFGIGLWNGINSYGQFRRAKKIRYKQYLDSYKGQPEDLASKGAFYKNYAFLHIPDIISKNERKFN
jgi:hypothetical protein